MKNEIKKLHEDISEYRIKKEKTINEHEAKLFDLVTRLVEIVKQMADKKKNG